ncbi:HAD-IA family hydrolase [Actinomadura madurae]|nr:HAD-IA family hydrolase [Actinomadura madurae]
MDLVRSLADAGVPLAVVTSGQRPYAEGLLAELGIRDLLDIVVTAGDVVTGKPHPEGYLAAARDLDVPPQETIGFEDAPRGRGGREGRGHDLRGRHHHAAGRARWPTPTTWSPISRKWTSCRAPRCGCAARRRAIARRSVR